MVSLGSVCILQCLCLGEFGVVVLYHPHVKLFEDTNPVVDGILFVIIPKTVLRRFKFSLRCIDISDGIGFTKGPRIFLQPIRV